MRKVNAWEGAACQRPDTDPSWWDQEDGSIELSSDEAYWQPILHRRAKMFCGICPVRLECLEDALADGYRNQYHIRGGMTEQERNAYLKQQLEAS